jgi:hypothetical protein
MHLRGAPALIFRPLKDQIEQLLWVGQTLTKA